MRPGRQSGDLELSVGVDAEAADERPGCGVERHHVRSKHRPARSRHPSSRRARAVPEAGLRIKIRHARNVVRLELAVRNSARAERDRKHHGARREHASSAAAADFRLSERRMPEAEKVPGFVECRRLNVESSGLTRAGCRPVERGVEEDVGFHDLAGQRVDHEAGCPKHPLELRLVLEPHHGLR